MHASLRRHSLLGMMQGHAGCLTVLSCARHRLRGYRGKEGLQSTCAHMSRLRPLFTGAFVKLLIGHAGVEGWHGGGAKGLYPCIPNDSSSNYLSE
eukprot:462648-Pelagomonas_calceolata.AAC.2